MAMKSKRVDGILKQVDERQKQKMGDERNWKGTLGNGEGLEKGLTLVLGSTNKRLGQKGLRKAVQDKTRQERRPIEVREFLVKDLWWTYADPVPSDASLERLLLEVLHD